MSEGHAKLSPSGAHRWMACPGSIVLESNVPDKGSVYADEGTAAHLLASWCLNDGLDPSNYLSEKITVGDNRFTVDEDMCDYVRSYVRLVKEYATDAHLMVESAVPIGHLTGEDGATGTSDAIIVSTVNRSLTVVDLKYGMGVRVDATDNPQLMLYALGAYEQVAMLTDFDTVTMVIHMPRLNHVSEWTIPMADLLAFGDSVPHYAAETRQAEADEAAALGALKPTDSGWKDKYLNPGEKQCRFCKAKSVCPALRDSVMETVTGSTVASVEEFEALEPIETGSDTGDNYLSVAMDKVELIEAWCKSIRAEVERRLFAGQRVTGYKLVEGKRGNRQWTDEEKAAQALRAAKLKADDIFTKKLISPTEAEKRLKGSPTHWAKAEGLITQSAGKPSVAKATDKRPEVAVTAVADDFRDII